MGSLDQSHRRSLAAIFSDLEGHSLVWTRTPREKMVAAIGEYRYLSELIASQYGALHRNFTGDGHLFLFRTADSAVQFGLKLIDAWVHCRNTASALRGVPSLPMRLGCHVGICSRLGDSDAWVGSAEVLAKRVEEAAAPDSIYVTENVLDLIDLPLYRFEEAGAHNLKGDFLPARNLYRVKGFDETAQWQAAEGELTAEGWFLKGTALVGTPQENSDEEAKYYREALRLRPDYPEAHNNLGILLRAQGDTAGAADQYREALRLRPDYPEAHDNYAILLQQLGKAEGAGDHYREALRLRPDYVDAHCGYASLLAAGGQQAAAAEHYQQVLLLRPEHAEAHNNFAALLERQGDTDSALHHYQEALRIRPDYPEAHYNCALLLEERGALVEAEDQYRLALRLRPDYAEAHNNLGTILQGKGNLAEAEEHYAHALRLRPNDPEAHYNYGLLLKARQEHAQAAHHFRIAYELAPEVPTFRTAANSSGT